MIWVKAKPEAKKVRKAGPGLAKPIKVIIEREIGNVYNFRVPSLGVKGGGRWFTTQATEAAARKFCKAIGWECTIINK